MANKKPKQVSLQLRRDSAANWEAKNPVLLDGEEVLVYTSTGAVRRKIGDGIAHYNELPYDDDRMNAALAQKQSKLTGTAGQVVGFDSSGNASPQQVLADDVYFLDGDTVEEKLVGKQDKLTGTAGQIVGFNAQGAAQAQAANFLPAAEGKLILNDVDFNGYNIDELSTLSVACVQFVPFGKTSPIASIDVSVKGYETAYFEALDLRVSPTPKYIYSATSKDYVDTAIANSLPQETTVTLTTAGWVLGAAAPEPSITPVNQQTVSVPGILKDQTKQTVDVAPADKASRDAWAKANIWCNDPTADGSLTFVCDTVPTAAVKVRVRWQGVKA